MAALPEITNISASAAHRSVTYHWPLGHNAEGGEINAELYVAHNADRRYFFARLQQVVLDTRPGYSTVSFSVFDGVNVSKEYVARYSAKALRAYADRTMREVLGAVEADEASDEVAAKFVLPVA